MSYIPYPKALNGGYGPAVRNVASSVIQRAYRQSRYRNRFGNANKANIAMLPKTGSKIKSGTSLGFVKRSKTTTQKLLSGNGAVSYFNKTVQPKLPIQIMKKLTPVNTWTANYSDRLSWADGRQAVKEFIYYDTQPLSAILAQLPVPGPAGNLTRRFLLQDMYGEFTFSNASNSTCYVYVYDILCKKDLDSTSTQDSTVLLPNVAWNNGEIQQGNTLGNSMIGTFPSKVKDFTSFYKILSKKGHFMKAGDVHKHKVSLKLNRLINESLISKSSYYGGLTHYTMICAYGVPCDNDAVPPVVTTSNGALDMVYTTQYRYKWMQDYDTDSVIFGALPTGVAGLEVIEDDGDIVPVTLA